MKKFLSVLLAVMMVLSTVSFAAPSLADVADTAVEAPVEEAVLAEDVDVTYPVLKAYEFTDGMEGVAYNSDAGVDESHYVDAADNNNGYLRLTMSQEATDIHNSGTMVCSVPAGELYDIQIRFRLTPPAETELSANSLVYPYFDGTLNASKGINFTTYAVDGSWNELSFRTNGSFETRFNSGNLTAIRFDFSSKYPVGTVIDIDYVRFVGLPTQPLALDMGSNTEMADTTVNVSANATVATVVSMIVPPPASVYYPVGLKTTEGTVLDAAVKVADYDELVVVWQKYDDFGFVFDTSAGVAGNGANFVKSELKTDDDVSYYTFTSNGTNNQNRLIISGLVIPEGELTAMYIRMRTTAFTYAAHGMFWGPTGVTYGGGSGKVGTIVEPANEDGWFTVKYDPTKITSTESGFPQGNILADTGLGYLRYDFPISLAAGSTVDIDFVKFIGQPVDEATLVMDPATAPAEKASYTVTVDVSETATADSLINRVDYSDYYGTKYPYALLIDGDLYTGNDVVGNLIANGDNVAVAWTELNIIAGSEFSSADDVMSDSECDEVVENGVLKLTRTATGEIYLNFADPLNVAEVDDIQIRLRYVGNEKTDTTTQDYWYVFYDGTPVNHSITYSVDDGEWITLSYKKHIGGSVADVKSASTVINSFRTPHFDADVMPIGTSIEIDFVRVIGFPAFDVEVDAGELGTLTGKYTKNTTVKQFVDSLEYPVSAKIVTGIVGAEDTDLVADLVAENGTLTAVLGDNIWFGEYGVKVWSVDFDDATVGETLAREVAFTDLGAVINPAFNAALGTLKLQLQGVRAEYADPTVTVEGTDSDKYIKFVAGADGGTNVIMAYCNQFYSTDDGHYVLSYDLKTPDTGKATTVQFNKAHQIEEGAYKVVYDLTADEWGTVVGYYPKNERYSNDAGTAHIDTIEEINIIKLAGKNTVAGDELYFDNITLWWLPKSVEVTVDVGTANAEAEDATFAVSPAGTTAGDLAAKVYGGKKTVAGLALTAGGEALDADKPLILTGDTTLYVTGWDDVSYLEEWGAEFDTDAGYSYTTFTGGEYIDDYNSPVYGAGNTYGEDYIEWNEDGYITMSYDVSESDKTAAGSVTPVVYDSVLYIDGLDGTPESHAESFVKAGSVKAIQFRYRFTGDIVAKDDEVYYGGAVKTATAAFAPYLYVWSSGESAKAYNVLPEITTSGEWVIATVAAADLKLDVNDLYVLRLDVPDCMPAGATFDVDYIRFLGDTAEAPTTLSAATALRENKAGETYKNAIRFMATVNAVTKTRAADIGWLVSTEAYLGSDELTYDKYVAGSNKVKVAYQKQNGADAIANYFNTEDDDANVFAAFLYNIPEKNALDNVVVRPFVKSGSKYLYGEAVTTNLYEMAVEEYVTILEDDINTIVADGWTYDDAVDVMFEIKTDAPADKQAYAETVLRAILG